VTEVTVTFLHITCKPQISTWNLSTFLESQRNVDSNDMLYVRKYSQLFMHELNIFLLKIRPLKPLGQWWQTTPKFTPSLQATWTPILYINACVHPIHHTKRQLDWFTHFPTTTQQRPHWLQWDAQHSPLKLPLLLRR